jgi:hypothetical protein
MDGRDNSPAMTSLSHAKWVCADRLRGIRARAEAERVKGAFSPDSRACTREDKMALDCEFRPSKMQRPCGPRAFNLTIARHAGGLESGTSTSPQKKRSSTSTRGHPGNGTGVAMTVFARLFVVCAFAAALIAAMGNARATDFRVLYFFWKPLRHDRDRRDRQSRMQGGMRRHLQTGSRRHRVCAS